MKPNPAVTVIGPGAVGSAWIDYFRKADYSIKSVWNRNSGEIYLSRDKSKKITGRSYPNDDSELGDLIFIITPDSIIEEVAVQLSNMDIDWSSKSVVHCSGSHPASVLEILAQKGAKIASMHPIQTFQKGDTLDRLNNIYISLQGDEDLIKYLEGIVIDVKSTPLILDQAQKQAVHISAVFASNYLVALLNTSDTILKRNGVEDGVQILKPLIAQTVQNIFTKGPAQSLTGPISRGDQSTVRDHLDRLSGEQEASELYTVLGKVCLQMVKEQNRLTDKQISELEKLIKY